MKLKLQNTYRHLLDFTSKDETRPVLRGFHFSKEGHIEATNAHILLRLLTVTKNTRDFTMHPKELREIEGNYPDTDRLFPAYPGEMCRLDPVEAAELVKFLKKLDKELPVILSIKSKELTVTNTFENISVDLIESSIAKDDEVAFFFNGTYLRSVLAFIADCSPLPVEFSVFGPYRPLIFRALGYFEGMIAPMKMTREEVRVCHHIRKSASETK